MAVSEFPVVLRRSAPVPDGSVETTGGVAHERLKANRRMAIASMTQEGVVTQDRIFDPHAPFLANRSRLRQERNASQGEWNDNRAGAC